MFHHLFKLRMYEGGGGLIVLQSVDASELTTKNSPVKWIRG